MSQYSSSGYTRPAERTRTRTPSLIQTWTVYDPRERFVMDSRFRMRIYDVLLNFLVFTPLIILHHQACNGMLDLMFLRQFPTIGAWVLLVVGVGIEFTLCFLHRTLLRVVPKSEEMYVILASHAFLYILTFGHIAHIRAVGDLYGLYIGEDWRSAVKAMTTGLAALVALKACKNLMAPPLTLTIDSHIQEDVFHTPTLFSTEGDLSPGSALDSFATVAIVHSFIHLFWSGWWSFLDVWLFPGNLALSSLACIVLGYLGCLLAILLHDVIRQISRLLQQDNETGRDDASPTQDLARLCFENAYHILAGISVITTWRGFWFGFYVLGDQFPILYKGKDVTCVAAHVISFALLALANVSTSLCGKGVDIDGAERDGQGIVCSVDYFCEYFKDELEEEEESRRRQHYPDSSPSRRKPVAKVMGSQKLGVATDNDVINGSTSAATPSSGRQRVVQKKVDDDVIVTKRKQLSDVVTTKPPVAKKPSQELANRSKKKEL